MVRHAWGQKFPHCRPQGLYNPKNKTWNVRLFWQPLNPKPTILIESFTHKERKERLMNQIFSPSQSQPQITYLTNFISTNPNHLHQKKDEKREMKSIIVLYPISSDMTKKINEPNRKHNKTMLSSRKNAFSTHTTPPHKKNLTHHKQPQPLSHKSHPHTTSPLPQSHASNPTHPQSHHTPSIPHPHLPWYAQHSHKTVPDSSPTA